MFVQRIAVFHLEQQFPLETEIDEPVILFLNFYKYQDSDTFFFFPFFLQFGRQGDTFSLETDTIAHADWYYSCLPDARGRLLQAQPSGNSQRLPKV